MILELHLLQKGWLPGDVDVVGPRLHTGLNHSLTVESKMGIMHRFNFFVCPYSIRITQKVSTTKGLQHSNLALICHAKNIILPLLTTRLMPMTRYECIHHTYLEGTLCKPMSSINVSLMTDSKFANMYWTSHLITMFVCIEKDKH